MADSNILTLDVGGTRMKTMRSTLCRYPNSMLAKMFDSKSQIPPALTEDGAYFVDRDPEAFQNVLTFLRSEKLNDQLTERELKSLKVEAEFFMLSDLEMEIEQRLEDESDLGDDDLYVQFKVDGQVQKVEKRLFGKVPFQRWLGTLRFVIGNKIFFDKEQNCIVFFDSETFALIINSLIRGKDDLCGDHPSESKAVRLLLFLKNSVMSGTATVNVVLKGPEIINRTGKQNYEYPVERGVLSKDKDSNIHKNLTKMTNLPHSTSLASDGSLILKSSQPADKVLALFAEMKYSCIMKSTGACHVDEMSALAREIGVLSDDKILTATQFVRSSVSAVKRARRV